MRKITKILMSAIMVGSLVIGLSSVEAINYLPGVTSEMSKTEYWTDDNEVLMTWDEITELNELTFNTKGTNMYDLKNQPEVVDGIALNERLKTSTKADADYYLGWTYLGKEKLATEKEFDKLVKNTQNKNAKKNQKVKYAVAVTRSELRAFPSDLPIWDDLNDLDFDYQYLVGLRVNEPIVITSISADKKYYLAKNACCSGWVSVDDVAVFDDKEEWLAAWDIAPKNALVVSGDKVYTETSITGAETSDFMLTMGTVLELANIEDTNTIIDNRAIYQNHIVWIPTREEDGKYSRKLTLISENEKVSAGYLPLTRENIAEVALSSLGNTYGWGGMLNSDDCSSYVRNIYKCFGLELARNTTWQTAMPMAKVSLANTCREERIKILDSLPLGSVLYFSGHEMMYLGKVDDEYYVISAVGSIMNPYESGVKQRVRSNIINTLNIKRANGLTWLDSLTTVNVPYWGLIEGKTYDLPKYNWYHEGVAYCLKNKLMKAEEDGFFYPGKEVTRAELVQLLWNLEKQPKVEIELPFSDISEIDSYVEAIRWAYSNGIISGTDETTFTPNGSITREQLATILYKYAKLHGQGFGELWMFRLEYLDANTISEYAYEPICWLTMNKVMGGVDSENISPKTTVTRAQLAVMIQKFAPLLETEEK